jgi:hypothetical protein
MKNFNEILSDVLQEAVSDQNSSSKKSNAIIGIYNTVAPMHLAKMKMMAWDQTKCIIKEPTKQQCAR